MPSVYTILGGPGSGKTQKVIDIIAEKIKNGVRPDEVAYITFSNTMARRGVERIEGIVGEKTKLWYAGTCHGLGFRIASSLGYQKVDYVFIHDFFKKFGVPFSPFSRDIGNIDKMPIGNKYIYVREMFIKDNMMLVREASESFFSKWYSQRNFPLLLRYANTSKIYYVLTNLEDKMIENNLIDFVDMLLIAHKHVDMINVEYLFHDEANDMDNLMFRTILNFKREVYIAGDTAQVCYDLFGASPRFMDDLARKSKEIIELKKSYRVPEKVGRYAERFLDWIPYIVSKPEWAKKEGSIERVHFNVAWFARKINEQPIRILFFTNYNLNEFAKILYENGLPYYVDSSMAERPPWDKETLISLILLRNMVWKIKNNKNNSITAKEISAFNKFSSMNLSPLMIPVFQKGNYLKFLRLKPEWAKWIEYSLKWNFEFKMYPELSTIHSFKGGEEVGVMLDTRVPWYFYKERDFSFVKEYFARLMYIAITRTIRSFYFLEMPGHGNNVFDLIAKFSS